MLTDRRRALVLSLAVLLVVALALALVAPAWAGTTHRVRARSRTFDPARIRIAVGDRVVWRSVNGTHTVTAYSQNWSKAARIDEGERTSYTFRQSGRYKYRCTLHSTLSSGVCEGMCGVVRVG